MEIKGHVRQRRNGKWEYSLPQGYGADGKKRRITKGGFATKVEAEQALIQIAYNKGKHLDLDASKQNVYTYLQQWIDLEKCNFSVSHAKNTQGLISNHIAGSRLGNMKLKDVRPDDIEQFYYQLSSHAELSPKSIQHMHGLLSKAFEKARKRNYIDQNPAKEVTKPRNLRKPSQPLWSTDQMRSFLRIAKKSRWYVAFLLAAFTGARQGEILALRWQDIDFDKGTLFIQASLTRTDVGHRMGSTKTQSSVRKIGLPAPVLTELRCIQHSQHEKDERLFNEKLDYIVHTHNGNYVSPYNFSKEWRKLHTTSGLPPMRFHDFRHLHATLLLENGVNFKAVSTRLGHSSCQITLDTYSHVTKRMEDGLIDVLEDRLLR